MYRRQHSYAQLGQLSERRNDTALQKQIKKIVLSDNRFIDAEKKDFITLFTIVRENAWKNKDSLMQESKELYRKIVAALGKRWENENIDIS